MIVALTGATGFAGQHVLRAILARGHRVRLLVRDRMRFPGGAGIEVIEGDLRQPPSLVQLASGADVVVNLAGAIAARSRAEFVAVNAHGTKFLANAAKTSGVRRFIHMSSLAAREPLLSAYGESKRMAELALGEQRECLILRPPPVYGPGDRGTLPLIQQLTAPIAFIPSGVSARFSLIYAPDLAEMVADFVDNTLTGLHEVHDGRSGGYSWDDLVGTARSQEGVPRRVVFLPRSVALGGAYAAATVLMASSRAALINPGKVRELYHPDWTCKGGLSPPSPTSFAEGFAATVAWYRKEGWLPPRRNPDKSRSASKRGEVAE